MQTLKYILYGTFTRISHFLWVMLGFEHFLSKSSYQKQQNLAYLTYASVVVVFFLFIMYIIHYYLITYKFYIFVLNEYHMDYIIIIWLIYKFYIFKFCFFLKWIFLNNTFMLNCSNCNLLLYFYHFTNFWLCILSFLN